MAKNISVSDETFARLQAIARPFEDREPEDVILRLLDRGPAKATPTAPPKSESRIARSPRERGVVVELDGHRISASTVPDLCTQVMEYIYSKGLWERFEALAPYKTSSKRYLFSKTSKHPQGNDFFVPLKYRNIFMEAHKNYETTITQLSRLMDQLDVKFEYVR